MLQPTDARRPLGLPARLKKAARHYHLTVFLSTAYHGSDGSPPACNEKISGTEKEQGKEWVVFVCFWWTDETENPRKPGQGQKERDSSPTAPRPVALILPTYQYSADRPSRLLSGWN